MTKISEAVKREERESRILAEISEMSDKIRATMIGKFLGPRPPKRVEFTVYLRDGIPHQLEAVWKEAL